MARTGKIARLPAQIRADINRRLMDGESGRTILAWLNRDPKVKAVLKEHFAGRAISDQNITEWRQGGYQDWLDDQDQIRKTKALAEFASRMANAANGSLSEGAAAIAAGRVYEVLEAAADEDLPKLIESLAILRAGDHTSQKLSLQAEKLEQSEQRLDLDRKKFQRQTCDLFLKYYQDKQAKEIAGAKGVATSEKTEMLGKHIFGDLW